MRPDTRGRPIWIVGTADTKGAAMRYLADLLRQHGEPVLVMDVGASEANLDQPKQVTAEEVARRAGVSLNDLRTSGRAAVVDRMGEGARRILLEALQDNRVAAVVGVGGSTGSAIASAAMSALPVGVPKVLISTLAGGDTRHIVGSSDMALFSPVVDLIGMNRVLQQVLANAAAAAVGMARAEPPRLATKPVCALTAFGVTTPCAEECVRLLEDQAWEVLVFHARGTGGRAMESMIRAGHVDAVLDLTTTELADEVAGGVLSAGPDRLEAAGDLGIPQVIVPGALDVVNLAPAEVSSGNPVGRLLYRHNPNTLLGRTTAAEMARLGRLVADKVNRSKGPAEVLVPLGGFSDYDRPGQPFYDPAADSAFVESLDASLVSSRVTRVEAHINDLSFAELAVQRLLALVGGGGRGSKD